MTEFPRGWTSARLSEICAINPRIDKTALDPASVVSFVPMPAVEAETGKIDVSETRNFETVRKGYTPFQKGDVLFAKITPCMENGKMAIVPDLASTYGFGSTEFHVLRPRHGIDPRFIYHAVSNRTFRFHAEHNMTGAVGQKRVPAAILEEHEIHLPPTNDQRRIVERIEALFEEIGRGVENLRAAKNIIELYRQSLLKSAFEGRLTAAWRAQNPDKLESPDCLLARIRGERENRYMAALDEWEQSVARWRKGGEKGKKPTKPKQPKRYSLHCLGSQLALPELPHGWAWSYLGCCSTKPEYGTAAKSSTRGEVPVVRMGNVQNGGIDWSNLVYTSNKEEIAQYSLQSGDVLFNRTNSPELVGKTAIYRSERSAVFAGYLIRVNQIDQIASGRYVAYFLNSPRAREHGKSVKTDGVNQSNINGTKLQEYPFPICSAAEQTKIVRILEARFEATELLDAEIDAALARAEALRQSILKRAFAGQLVPQDPDDEPAPALLERIRAGRARVPATKQRTRVEA